MKPLFRLDIERLAFGGSGVGRIDGKVCFVPFSAPGDCLKVRIVCEHRSHTEAELVEIINPSPLRVQPPCPAFGQCGGCDWQHIGYPAQCQAKHAILRETLFRIAKMSDAPVHDTVASPQQYGYRSRAQFKLHRTPDGLAAGFYRRGSRFVINLPQGCPIVTPAINTVLLSLCWILEQFPDSHRIPQVSLEEGLDGVVAVVHVITADPEPLRRHLLRHQQHLRLAGLFLQSGRKESLTPVWGSGHLSYVVPRCGTPENMALGYEIGGFSQVNRVQNRTMVALVCAAVYQSGNDLRLLDLYCGNGNLSLPLASQVRELLGIEGFAPSLASAVDNARQLHVNNSTFQCQDAAIAVQQLVQRGERFDLVLLDPPRQGAVDAVRELEALRSARIVYVSCDPATLARDLAILCNGSGYRLERVIPLDMFPQTAHLETVAVLQK